MNFNLSLFHNTSITLTSKTSFVVNIWLARRYYNEDMLSSNLSFPFYHFSRVLWSQDQSYKRRQPQHSGRGFLIYHHMVSHWYICSDTYRWAILFKGSRSVPRADNSIVLKDREREELSDMCSLALLAFSKTANKVLVLSACWKCRRQPRRTTDYTWGSTLPSISNMNWSSFKDIIISWSDCILNQYY